MTQDCRSCFNCRIINKNTKLKCKIGFWIDADGKEKRVKLNQTERRSIEEDGDLININMRELFKQARKCLFYPE